jgi:acyl carrier protein
MNNQEIESIVINLIKKVIKSEVSPDSKRKDLAKWDSLKHIEIMFLIEDELNVRFSEEELADLDSVIKIIDAINKQNAT